MVLLAYVRSAFTLPAYPGPVVVLGAQRRQAGSTPTFQELRVKLLKEIAEHYPQSELRWIDASHYIQREQPQAVSDALRCSTDSHHKGRAEEPLTPSAWIASFTSSLANSM